MSDIVRDLQRSVATKPADLHALCDRAALEIKLLRHDLAHARAVAARLAREAEEREEPALQEA